MYDDDYPPRPIGVYQAIREGLVRPPPTEAELDARAWQGIPPTGAFDNDFRPFADRDGPNDDDPRLWGVYKMIREGLVR